MLHIVRSLKNSLNGLRTAWPEDLSFRISTYQLLAGSAVATALALYADLHVYTWLLLVGSLFPILWLETVNTSIEAVTDKASPERHPLAKKAKDIGSASVLLARIFALICWGAVIIQDVL